MKQDEQIKTLTIQELLNQDNYIIPIYQRNYAWGDSEIEALLTDLVKAYERKTHNYYIGSLVVYRRDDGQFEVIDGQQRLTTFTLIKHFLQNDIKLLSTSKENHLSNRRNISFEYRAESDKALDNLQNSENLPWNFKDAMQSIKRSWNKLNTDKQPAEIIDFILKKVQIIRTEVPPETDLNHYFEIMNTRGEQLEKHEVIKARFMSRLQELSQQITDKTEIPSFQLGFANIWDACSDMNRYVVMGFEPNTRKQIFGDNWQKMPSENFDEFTNYFKTDKNGSDNFNNQNPPTIANILANNTAVQVQKDSQEKSERFNSVIDFPNFLLHVLRIYHEKYSTLKDAKEVNLDEKNLLDSFQVEKFEFEHIKNFAVLLLQCRYLFDSYVIKSDTSKGDDDHWSLLKIQPQASRASSYQYNNSFGDTGEQTKVVMLLSMFHVSHPARIYKNWLYAVLRWLYQNRADISVDEYISFLEDLGNRYYFCNYGKGIDFFDFITQENPDMQLSSDENDRLFNILNSGTSVPNFIFNRLDYLLWKNKQGNYDKFSFTFRSSVEHFYPQTPQNGESLNDDILHSFGNLCLISSSMNSKFSNNMPQAKVANFGKEQNLSLKLSLMMENAEQWNDTKIEQHRKEMLDILNGKSS